VIAAAEAAEANAIYTDYAFPAENPRFTERGRPSVFAWIGPPPKTILQA